MHRIERAMTNRSLAFKMAFAVAALLVVLWVTGASFSSIWPIPAVVVALWFVIRLTIGARRRFA
jgi:hypothetical protein